MNKKITLILIFTLSIHALFASGHNEKERTIALQGQGVVKASPDQAVINISVSERADTSQEVLSLIQKKILQIIETSQKLGVSNKNIETEDLYLSPYKEWKEGESILKGQQGRQTLRITLNSIQQDPKKVETLIKSLSLVNGITLSSLEFSLKDPKPYYEQAREMAYKDGYTKAKQIASYADESLDKVLSISEEFYPKMVNISRFSMAEAKTNSLPAEKLECSVTLNLTFSLK